MMNKGTQDNSFPQNAADSGRNPKDSANAALEAEADALPPDAHVGEAPAPLENLRSILGPLASLRLTVALMVISMILIFAGTLAQVDKGIWTVMNEYFRTFFVWIPVDIFLQDHQKLNNPWIGFPWIGGYILGPALLINLLAAHIVRFRIKAKGPMLAMGLFVTVVGMLWIGFSPWGSVAELFGDQYHSALLMLFAVLFIVFAPIVIGSIMLFKNRAGVMLIHAALILLIGGEAVTALYAVESRMVIFEGEKVSHTIDIRESELAVIDHTVSDTMDKVITVPESILKNAAKSGETINHADLPFDIKVDKYMINSRTPRKGDDTSTFSRATKGLGTELPVTDAPEISGVSGDGQADMPSAVITLSHDGEELGTYIASTQYIYDAFRWLPQEVVVDGKSYSICMRFKHIYKPYAMKLTDFKHDLYPGTNTPRNFSSDVLWYDENSAEPREVLIKMNEPFREAGETFFQSDWIKPAFDDGPDRGTVLQVVKNPGADIPYIACIIGGLGLFAHFGLTLQAFLARRFA